MTKSKEFHEYVVHDLLAQIKGITSRAMFGGYGIYQNGKIFAIIVESILYFKVDERHIPDFKKYGSLPFSYKMKNGKKVVMSYWEVPEHVMEEHEELLKWVKRAVAIIPKKK